MKLIQYTFLIILTAITIHSCKSETQLDSEIAQVYQCPMKCEADKTYSEKGSCPVCKMDLKELTSSSELESNEEISGASIFNLTSTWFTEEGKEIRLDNLKGKTLVFVMIYTSCKAACPRLVADMRNIETQIPKEKLKEINFVLVSIDPETDSPERLKAFAKENFMDDNHWTFLQGSESGVREFANVLAMKYKQISPTDFSHSNIISVFNSGGELIYQQEGLGVNNEETVQTILGLTL